MNCAIGCCSFYRSFSCGVAAPSSQSVSNTETFLLGSPAWQTDATCEECELAEVLQTSGRERHPEHPSCTGLSSEPLGGATDYVPAESSHTVEKVMFRKSAFRKTACSPRAAATILGTTF